MKPLSISRSIRVFVATVFLAAGASFAQTSNGTIGGTIFDKSGAGVPNAIVTASSTDLGGEKRSTNTDSQGTYRIEALIPGRYVALVTAPGFAVLKISNVEVKASLTATVNGTLEVSAQATTVMVEASIGQELQTQSGELSANISKPEINNLPFLSLNPISLALTLPGVAQPSSREDFTNGVGFSVNGARPRANNFLIDGQDNNDNSINGQAFQPINHEAVGQVTILTNAYAAEFGRGGGSVTNVIYKGGTNKFHGSAWEIHRNSAVAAIPAEDKLAGVTSPVDIDNTFGFSFGGPIKKNKLFFFGSSQWDRERQTAIGSTLRLPTANGVAALQALGTNPNVAFLIASLGGLRGDPANSPRKIALGNGRPAVDTGRVKRSGVSEKGNDRQWNVRVDWNATSSDTMTVRYVRDDSTLTPDFFNFPGSLPPYHSQQGGPSQHAGITYIRTFSPHVVNEFRFSYGRIGFTFGPTAATAANPLFSSPLVSLAASGFPAFGFPTALPQGRSHTTWQYQDALNYTVGSHTFKIGVDITHLAVVDSIPFNSRGVVVVNLGGNCGGVTCTSLANFVDNLTGPTGSATKVFGNPVVRPFVTTYAPYVQDTWRLRPNFTLNLGLRYEYWGLAENILQFPAVDLSTGFGNRGPFPSVFSQQPDKNNFAPRIGFAYTPRFWPRILGHDKTVFRAGYGIFYDGLFTNILDNTAAASPNAVGGTIIAPGGATRGLSNPFGLISSINPELNRLQGVTSVDSRLRNPLTHQWNADIQREIPGGFVITAAYVGTRGLRLFVNQELNPRAGIDPVTGLTRPRVNPARGRITVRTNAGDSIYHAAQLTVDRKFSRGVLLRGAYTFSRLIDDGSEVFTTSGLSSFAQDPFNQKGDRGLSAFHRAHRLAITYIWELPYAHKSHNAGLAILKAITRDWQIAGTTFFQSGAPETVTTLVDTNGDGRSTNDRPNLADPTKSKFDPARYAIPSINSLGNVGRNDVLTPGRQDWNCAVQRTFRLSGKPLEGQVLMFRAEFFNAFNHPNLSIPTLTLDDPDFGDTSITRFGGRQIRIWVKYSF